jgi:CBS-domain-containing membrane protein
MQDIRLRDIVSPRKVVTVSGNQTAQDVLNLLSMHHISAVPVMNDDHRAVMGFVDVLDILAFLVKTSSKPLSDTGVGESRSLTTDDLLMIHKRTKDFKMAQVTELIGKIESVNFSPIFRPIEKKSIPHFSRRRFAFRCSSVL